MPPQVQVSIGQSNMGPAVAFLIGSSLDSFLQIVLQYFTLRSLSFYWQFTGLFKKATLTDCKFGVRFGRFDCLVSDSALGDDINKVALFHKRKVTGLSAANR